MHKRDVHGSKPGPRKKGKSKTPPPIIDGPKLAEEELLANCIGWFEQAEQTPEANRRVINYLTERYAPLAKATSLLGASNGLAPRSADIAGIALGE